MILLFETCTACNAKKWLKYAVSDMLKNDKTRYNQIPVPAENAKKCINMRFFSFVLLLCYYFSNKKKQEHALLPHFVCLIMLFCKSLRTSIISVVLFPSIR